MFIIFKGLVPVIWLDEPAFIIIYYSTIIIKSDIKTSLQELTSKNFGKISRNFTELFLQKCKKVKILVKIAGILPKKTIFWVFFRFFEKNDT